MPKKRSASLHKAASRGDHETITALLADGADLHRRICLPSADNNTAICPGGTRPPREMMVSFIDEHRSRYGVGPVCAELPTAPSTYYEHKGREGQPARGPARVRRDGWLCRKIRHLPVQGNGFGDMGTDFGFRVSFGSASRHGRHFRYVESAMSSVTFDKLDDDAFVGTNSLPAKALWRSATRRWSVGDYCNQRWVTGCCLASG